MSKKYGKIGNHKFRGDPSRFQVVAGFVADRYFGKLKRIADVAGGQGMLCRVLNKKYNFEAEVVDPRGFTMVGVNNRKEEYKAEWADFYDLVVGIHPDGALKEVVLSALVRPVIVIPCCNFWSEKEVLGREALLLEIEKFYEKHDIKYERVEFNFEGPKNIGLVSAPPS